MTNGYSILADFYDSLMIDVPYTRWISFISRRAREPKSSVRIVDAGCGTGTVALGLAKKGYNVMGVDQSAEMLSIAIQKSMREHTDVQWRLGSFVRLKTSADLVISTCDGVNHLLSLKDLVGFFSHAYNCLKDSGFLIFDINTTHKFRNILADNCFAWGIPGTYVIWKNYFSWPYNQANVNLFQLDTLVKTRFSIVQRCYTLASLIYYLKQVGFYKIELWNNYKNPLKHLDVHRITVVAKKTKGR